MNKESFCKRHLKMIPYVIDKMGLTKFEDDLTDIGYIGLVQACNSYKQEIGKESTFVYSCIKGAIIDEMKYMNRDKRDINIPVLSLEYSQTEEDEQMLNLIPSDFDIENNTIIKEWVNNMMTSCSGRDKTILSMLLKGFTQQDIADYFGITRQRMNQIVKRLRKKLKNTID